VLILYPECAQTHLCASVISKTFRVFYPQTPFYSRNETGQEKRVEIEELNDHEEEKNRKGYRKLVDTGQMENGLRRRGRHASSVARGAEGRCAPGD
jgi:hypothetical protein